MKRTPLIYLAGGMRSEWREKVKAALPQAIYLDPTAHGLTQEEEYTAWDLHALERSDYLFGYLEEANPSGYGLMVEIGAAWPLGVKVIFVDEKPSMHKYTGMARQIAVANATSLEEGIQQLIDLVRENNQHVRS